MWKCMKIREYVSYYAAYHLRVALKLRSATRCMFSASRLSRLIASRSSFGCEFSVAFNSAMPIRMRSHFSSILLSCFLSICTLIWNCAYNLGYKFLDIKCGGKKIGVPTKSQAPQALNEKINGYTIALQLLLAAFLNSLIKRHVASLPLFP